VGTLTPWNDRSTIPVMELEGWCTDPYAQHEARWMSDGIPTKLVRDGDTTSYDKPPDGPFLRDPEPIESQPDGRNAGPTTVGNEQDAVDVIEAFIVTGRTAPRRKPTA
jgi:hypothetical protein